LFAWGGGFFLLIVGRALIGMGVSACLMAGFQANTLWFSRKRLAGLNGWILAAGGVGAAVSTVPIEWALQRVDWRIPFGMVEEVLSSSITPIEASKRILPLIRTN